MPFRHVFAFTFLSLLTASLISAQPPEFHALQAHFDRVIAARHAALFDGISSVPQWQERKRRVRLDLARMLWHDSPWPSVPPAARVTHRTERPDYVIENIVLETAPDLYSTANLYLPRTGAKPFPVVLYQCGHASKNHYTRHGAWFAQHGIAALVMDNIEMGEVEFTHHGVYSQRLVSLV